MKTIVKMLVSKQRELLFCCLCLFHLSVFSVNLKLGEVGTLYLNTIPPNGGEITRTSWESSYPSIIVNGNGESCNVCFFEYNPSTVYVVCTYYYAWEVYLENSGRWRTMTGSLTKTFALNCIRPTLSIDKKEVTVQPGENFILNTSITNGYLSEYAQVKWSTSDNTVVNSIFSDVANYANGYRSYEFRAYSEGEATITASVNGGVEVTCKVKVAYKRPNSVTIPKTSKVKVGETVTLTPTLSPSDAQTTYSWSSDNTSIASVSQKGVVTGKKTGTARITVTTDNGKTDYCDVTVEKGDLTLNADKASGLYAKGTSVSLSANFSDADIYYTLDGSTPTENSTRYTEPITLNENQTLKAIAMGSEYNPSSLVTRTYQVTTLKATLFSPSKNATTSNAYITPSITFNEDIKVHIAFDKITISSESSNVTGRFVVDGTVLTFIPEKGELANGTYTIKLPQGAVANADGQPNFEDTYKFTVQSEKLTLAASAPAGVIIKGTGVAITANFNDAEIYYTLDGKTPTRESSRYTTPIIITDNTKLKAIAVGAKYRNSNVLSVDYVVTDLASTDCTPINGSRLTDMYSKLSISFNDQIKAGIGFRDITLKNGTTEVPGRFAIKENILFFEPSIGKYENGTYTLTLPDYAVLNQKNEPNTAFTNKFTIERNTATIKSDKQSGIVETGSKVTLTATPSDAKIYYTIDGRDPSVNSTLYTEPVVINHNTTLKAIAAGENYQQSEVFEGVYRMKNTLITEGVLPEDNTIVASKHTIPTIKFNESVWKGSGFENVTLKDSKANKVNGEIIAQNGQLYFVPDNTFVPGNYTLELPANALSDEVNNLNTNVVTSFSVGDENDRIESVFKSKLNTATYFIKKDKTLWAFGSGFLGDGEDWTVNRNAPVKIMDNVKTVAIGNSNTTFAIKHDGSLWGWGDCRDGRIGNGTSTNSQLVPAKIMDNVVEVYPFSDNTYALTEDGTLWEWGIIYQWKILYSLTYSDVYSYSSKDVTPTLYPKKIMTGIKDFSGNGSTVYYIIKKDDTLWSWGNSSLHFLGDGETDNKAGGRTVPKKILDNVKKCTLGDYSAHALKNDGTLWSWGQSSKGAIGNGLRVSENASPVRVLSDVEAFYDDGDYKWVIKKDRTLWTWGVNKANGGVNGIGQAVNSYYPQKVADNVIGFYRAYYYYYILDNNHDVWRISNSSQEKKKLTENIQEMNSERYVDNVGNLLVGDKLELIFKAAPIAPAVTSLEMTSEKLTVTTGHKAYVALNIQPADADYQAISFSSSNPQVATVSGTGIVTGVKEGTATINVTVDGKFKKTCEVTVTDNLDINIIPTQYGKLEPKEPSAKKGENVELAIIPDEEFELDSVCILDGYSSLVNYTIKENTITFTMPSSDVRITSAFKPVKYSLTVSESKHGTVTPSVQKAAFGEVITLDVSPNENYILDKCTITDKKGETVEHRVYGHTIEFSMPGSDVTITPTVREYVHTVKTEDTDNGEVIILPEKGAEGETISILLNPNIYYYFEGVDATDSDGKDVATELLDNFATFLMPNSDVAVNAAFMPLGDMNKDGVIDVADMVLTINHVLGKTVQDDGMAEKMDMNGDGQVDVGDVILIIKAILAQGGLVEVPAEARGKAETVDITKYTAMQLNVTVPLGTEVADMRMAGGNSDTHQLMYLKTGDNSYTVVVYSLDNQTFSRVEGCLLEVTLDGEGEAEMYNVLLATPAGERTFVGSMPMGTATGIRTVGGDVVNGNAVYDLRGNKMRDKGRLPKGVYIMNGKKVIK